MLNYLKNFDTSLFLFLNSKHNVVFDNIMWFLSGNIPWIIVFIAIIAHYIYHNKKDAVKLLLLLIFAIIISDQIASTFIKPMVERLRPSHNPQIGHLVHILNNYRGGKYGFVSSHAANSFAIATFTALTFNFRLYTIAIFAWAGCISYSRIYLGVHYPADIIGGACVGICSAGLMYFCYTKLQKQ